MANGQEGFHHKFNYYIEAFAWEVRTRSNDYNIAMEASYNMKFELFFHDIYLSHIHRLCLLLANGVLLVK